jgi:hypothetical protein
MRLFKWFKPTPEQQIKALQRDIGELIAMRQHHKTIVKWTNDKIALHFDTIAQLKEVLK